MSKDGSDMDHSSGEDGSTENLDNVSNNNGTKVTKPLPPMSAFEKSALLDLVNEYKGSVECKKTDFGSVNKKADAWRTISNRFCSTGGTHRRSAEQLKTWWKNCKQRAKKKVTQHKKSVKKTGGGTNSVVLSTEAETVLSIIPTQMKGLSNPFDDDASSEAATTSTNANQKPDLGGSANCHKITTEADKAGLLHVGVARKKKDARSSLTDMEYEEHKIRLRTLATEHETAVILKLKAETELKFLEIEHNARMDVLKSQIVSGPVQELAYVVEERPNMD